MSLTGGERPPPPSDDDYRLGDYVGVIAKHLNNPFDSDAGDNGSQAEATSEISTPKPATLTASSEVDAIMRRLSQLFRSSEGRGHVLRPLSYLGGCFSCSKQLKNTRLK